MVVRGEGGGTVSFVVHFLLLGQFPIHVHVKAPIHIRLSLNYRKFFFPLPFSVIMVVGAGRGPLVDASLRAAYSVNRRVMIYAVEKNPGAVIT